MTDELLTGDLVLRSHRDVAYLKLPKGFKERFGLLGRDDIPSPSAELDVTTDGEIRLTYVWDPDELEETA